jgi:glyoxalase family protein
MMLDGIHHVTCITGDAPRNVNFYAGTLGLRLVKKSVNQDDPTVYHLFFADEEGTPGSDITFFEYPGMRRGRPGAGMIYTVAWRVGSAEALDFWEERLRPEGTPIARQDDRLSFDDPEGLRHELVVTNVADEPLVAQHPEIPTEYALQGFDGVRAFSEDPDASRGLFEDALGFTPVPESDSAWGQAPMAGWEARGPSRGGRYCYDAPPPERGVPGAGTVHHVAWASTMEEHEAWRERVAAAGMHPTPVIDRFWFRSVYFREPSGVLFEIATLGPGFATDEDPEHLGESLVLPPAFEHLRDQVEAVLTPIVNPRTAAVRNP